MRKITQTVLAEMQPEDVMWDSAVKGFGARCRSQAGAVSFCVKTRVNGRQRLITIGKWRSPWTAETARKEAERILGKRHEGVDAGVVTHPA